MNIQAIDSTKVAIIVAAEELFVRRGIASVSLREIGAAAGQRNTAAAQYHFGDRESLVMSIVEYRMQSINDQRLKMLDQLKDPAKPSALRDLLEALILPLATVSGRGGYYCRFLALVHSSRSINPAYDWDTASSFRRVRSEIAQQLHGLPPETIESRIRMVANLVVHTVADHESSDGPSVGGETWISGLIDCAYGLLIAEDTGNDSTRNSNRQAISPT